MVSPLSRPRQEILPTCALMPGYLPTELSITAYWLYTLYSSAVVLPAPTVYFAKTLLINGKVNFELN